MFTPIRRIFAAGCLFFAAHASAQTQVTTPTVLVEPGETFSIELTVANSTQVNSLLARMDFVESEIALQSATPVPTAARSVSCTLTEPGRVTVNAQAIPPDGNIGDGNLCTLTFTVSPTAAVDDVYFIGDGESGCSSDSGDFCTFNFGQIRVVGDPEVTPSPTPGSTLTFTTSPGIASPPQSVLIFQDGNAPITVAASGLSTPFSVTTTQVGSDEPARVEVVCSSADSGTFTQNLVITTNDPDDNEGTLTYPVTCTVTGAEANPTPASGSTLPTITTTPGVQGSVGFTIANPGNTELAMLPQTLPAPFGIADDNGAFVNSQVPVGATKNYFVTCNTSTPGQYQTTLTINTNDANEPTITYNVACVVGSAEIDLSPPAGNALELFAPAGQPASTTFDIINTGFQPLTYTLSGLSGVLSAAPGAGTVPADTGNAAGVQTITVTCSAAPATPVLQTLTIASNDADEPTLQYTVRCAATSGGFISSPSPGTPIVINTSPGATGTSIIRVSSSGTGPLELASSGLSAPLSIAPAGPRTIPSDLSEDFTVSCNSADAGTFNQTLTFATNDPAQPTVTYPVQCVVAGPEVVATPASGTAFNLSAFTGQAANASVTVQNIGTQLLTFASATPVPPFTVSPQAGSLAPGASQVVTIGCNSATAGTFNTTFSFATNDANEPTLTYPVTCTVAAPGSPSIEIVSGDGQTGEAGTELGSLLIVRLLNPAAPSGFGAGVPVEFSVQQGDAVFGSTRRFDETVVSSTDGTAGVQVLLGENAGPIIITASAAGYGTVAFGIESTAGEQAVRSLVAVSGNDQVAQASSEGVPLVAALRSGGQPVAGQTITWTIVSGTDVTLAARSSVTDAEGRASVGIRFGEQPTTTVIEARDATGLVARFTILRPSAAARFVIVSGEAQTGGRQTLADAPIVFELIGANGPIPDAEVTFAIIEGTATLSNATATTDAQGRASVRLRYGNTVGRVIVQATALSGSVRGTASAAIFDVVLGKAAGDNQTGPVSTKLPIPLTIQIARPPAGKGLGGAPVTWTVVAGGGTLSNVQNVTDANGRATAELTLGPQPGNNQVRAAITGLGEALFNATATPVTPGNIQILTGNNQTLATNETSGPLTVRLLDQNGQPVPNARIRWTASDDVELSATETRTDANGNASVTALLLQPGGGTVTATAIDAPNAPTASFTLNGGIVETEGATESEQNVARALDEACPILAARAEAGQALTPAQQDLLARCIELIEGAGEIPGETRTALEELIAEEATAQNNAALIVQASQFDNLKARIAALRSGTQGASFSGLALQTSDGALPLSFLPSAILGAAQDEGDEGGRSDEVGADFSRWGFFATGTIGQGDRDGDEDGVRNDPGFAFDTYGLTAGVDYRYSDRLVFGAALGYNRNDTQLDGNDGGLDATGYSLSGYATWYQGDAFYVDSVVTFGSNEYDLDRRIRYSIANPAGGTTNVDQVATASPGSDQTSFAISVGKDWAKGAWSIGPYMRGLYTRVDFDGYEETLSNPNAPGAGLGVSVDSREIKSMQAVLGGKISYTKSMSWGILIPNAQVEYLHEFEDDPAAVITRFVADPTGTPIEIETATVDTGYFNLGFGLSAVFAQGRSAFVYFEHRAGQDRVSYDNLAVGVRIEF